MRITTTGDGDGRCRRFVECGRKDIAAPETTSYCIVPNHVITATSYKTDSSLQTIPYIDSSVCKDQKMFARVVLSSIYHDFHHVTVQVTFIRAGAA